MHSLVEMVDDVRLVTDEVAQPIVVVRVYETIADPLARLDPAGRQRRSLADTCACDEAE